MRREGSDLTIVATSFMLHEALMAAESLSAKGISAEVIDSRSVRPIDHEILVASARKPGQPVFGYDGIKTPGIGAEISEMDDESDAFDLLDAPKLPVGGPDNPIPNDLAQEKASAPQIDEVGAGVEDLVGGAF